MPKQAPPAESKPLFLQYAALEEEYGLARSAMEVYEKAVRTVPENERLSVYNLYLARAHQFFGLGKVRCQESVMHELNPFCCICAQVFCEILKCQAGKACHKFSAFLNEHLPEFSGSAFLSLHLC